MEKVDFKKELKHLYQPPRNFVTIEVPEMAFIMVDGHGDPNTAQEYRDAVEALYAVAYKIKFISKEQIERDYTVPPLESLWWAEDPDAFRKQDKSSWNWTTMIMTPEWISEEIFAEAVIAAHQSKDPAALDKVRLERFREGLSVQIMHLGSYDDEAPVLAKMHDLYMPENGYVENGKHHEIYLSDPRRVTPEKLRTVLRQPVRHS